MYTHKLHTLGLGIIHGVGCICPLQSSCCVFLPWGKGLNIINNYVKILSFGYSVSAENNFVNNRNVELCMHVVVSGVGLLSGIFSIWYLVLGTYYLPNTPGYSLLYIHGGHFDTSC